jgi:oligoendopeptidase F
MEHPTIPTWSLSTLYQGFNSEKHAEDWKELRKAAEALQGTLRRSPALLEEKRAWLTEVLAETDKVIALYEQLEAYAYCRYSTNTADEDALRGLNTAEQEGLAVRRLLVALKNSLARTVGEDLKALTEEGTELSDYRFVLQEMIEEQSHQMPEAQEDLAADLLRSGAQAWGRLQEAVSSSVKAIWDEQTGEYQTMTGLRSQAHASDRGIRKKAFDKELALWKQYEIPLAFALNGVKGAALTLDARRNYPSSLERSLRQSRITADSLDALIDVMEESLPVFRRYLKLKASALGLERLAFYDLFAPLESDARQWSFDEAREFIVESFMEFHPEMGIFARDAFQAGWIDALPREGKVGGAYCIHFPLQGESRVLCNFNGSLSSVSTIAHELGHAYHGHVLKDEPQLLSSYPMTLAETASIFAETVVMRRALSRAEGGERITVIEAFLEKNTQVIVDILSRFYFERELFSRRAEGELSPTQLCAMMEDAQRRTYGDGLDQDALHPYMWAVKGHYYRPELAFYNYPYAFGQLFGLGLYARYEQEGAAFRSAYDTVLRLTGRLPAAEVTALAGCSIEDRDFWRQGIAAAARFVDEFALMSSRTAH